MLFGVGLPAATPPNVSGTSASTLISQLTDETSEPPAGMLMMSTLCTSEASVAPSLVVPRLSAAPVSWVQLPVSSSVISMSKSPSAGDGPGPS
jgi:hypothetical protein